MKHFFYLFILICIASINTVFSQSNLRLLNGKETNFIQYSIDYDEAMFYYQIKKSNGKLKTKSLLLDEIYSFTDSLNQSTIIYKPLNSDMLSIEAMGNYTLGYKFGRNEYNPYGYFVGGLLVGTGGMFISKNPLLTPLIPIAFTATIRIIPPSSKKLIAAHPELKDNNDLIYGYKRSARNKNIKYAAAGSIAGMLIGALIGSFTGYYN